MGSVLCFLIGHRFPSIQIATSQGPYAKIALAAATCSCCLRRFEARSEGHGWGDLAQRSAIRQAEERLRHHERNAWDRAFA